MTTPSPDNSTDPDNSTNPVPSWHRRTRWWLAGVAGALVLAGAVGGGYAIANAHHNSGDADARAMAERAAAVMPFDLNATSHSFTKTDSGGVEQVVANDPADQRNIDLIRQHLGKEADLFARGVYTDPATIHGMHMPGLRELQAGADRVQVRYEQMPSGARITYSSTDPVLVAALHSWFDAQNSDHSMPGMGMNQ